MPTSETRPASLDDFGGILDDEFVGVCYGVDKSFLDSLLFKEGIDGWREHRGDCEVVTYRAGEDLFAQGQSTTHLKLYLVLSGLFAVKHIYRVGQGEKDKTLIVAFDPAGTVIGEVEFYLQNLPSQLIPRGMHANAAKGTITAMTQSTTLELAGAARQQFLEHDQVSRRINRLFALKILRRSARGDALQVYDLEGVLAAVLKRLALDPLLGGVGREERDRKAGAEWPVGYSRLKLRIQQDAWGLALGKSTVTVGALFKSLEKRHIAAYRKDGVIFVSDEFVNGKIMIQENFNFFW